MNSRRFLGVAMTASLMASASLGTAQVLDNPLYFALPGQSGARLDPFPGDTVGAPSTFQIGEVDPTVTVSGTNAPLNDLVILNSSIDTPDGLNQRVYVIRHTSGTDTQALSLATPQDIDLGDSCLSEVSSVQLADMNGDAINDVVYASNSCFAEVVPDTKLFGFLSRARVYGMAGTGSGGGDSFTGGPVLLGFQENASLPAPTSFLLDGSQPVIATAQFRANAGQDVAFYDYSGEDGSDLLRVLENDGSLGLLTAVDNPIQGLFPEVGNSGSSIVAGDFNGDGNQDVAMVFQGDEEENVNSRLRVFLGDGSGNFSDAPAADADLGDPNTLHGLTSGDFDGNAFLDFATIEATPFNMEGGPASQVIVVTCSPGSPASCAVDKFPVNDVANIGISVTAADFDEDGLDDLAFAQIFIGQTSDVDTDTNVQVHLNQGGGFNATPDQTLTLNPEAVLPNNIIVQVIAKDIDACGGPDLAFIGISEEDQEGGGEGLTFAKFQTSGTVKNGAGIQPQLQAAVAFNANEEPVANAGSGTSATVGGDPTCTDPTGDGITIQWTVVSGTASISDATASNPTITNASDGAVLQVTCTDTCGASDSATVTLGGGGGLIEGSGCALSTGATSPSGLALFAGLLLALPLLRLRRGE